MEEINEDRRGPDKDMWEETRIDFSKIAGEKSVLYVEISTQLQRKLWQLGIPLQ